jgi:hypothetical protein
MAIISPTGDKVTGLWTTTPLFNKIDEFNSDDSDFISSPNNPTGNFCEVFLSGITPPTSLSNHVLTYRYSGNISGSVNLKVELYHTGLLITGETHTGIANTWIQNSITLTTGQAFTITNYSGLSVRFYANTGQFASAGGGGLLTNLFWETYEGAGYSNGGWTEQGAGTIDEDYTTVALAGSQSLRIVTPADGSSYTYKSFTQIAECWAYMLFRPVAHPGADYELFEIWNNDQIKQASLHLRSNGTLFTEHGLGFSTNTVGTMNNNNTYHIYFNYVKSTSSNGVASVGFSTDGSRPTAGDNFVTITTGTATGDAFYITPGLIGFDGTNEAIFDNVQVGDSNSEP